MKTYHGTVTKVDFIKGLRLPMCQSTHEILDFVDDVLGDLGSRSEINYLRNLVECEQSTGADHQIALYQQTGSTNDVIHLLLQQTVQGIPVSFV